MYEREVGCVLLVGWAIMIGWLTTRPGAQHANSEKMCIAIVATSMLYMMTSYFIVGVLISLFG